MKSLTLILCLTVGLTVSDAQTLSSTANEIITNTDQDSGAHLQLSTSINEQRYSAEAGSKLLRLTLNLTYTNIGEQTILLDKNSSLVYKKVLSKNFKAMSKKKYNYDASSSFIDVRSMQAAGMHMNMRSRPEKHAFIALKPKDSYNLKKEIILYLYDGSKVTQDSLYPGKYFLQIRVATWYYFADPEEYREKWRGEGLSVVSEHHFTTDANYNRKTTVNVINATSSPRLTRSSAHASLRIHSLLMNK